MKAKIEPLNGKHYGTEITIVDGDIKTSITVWCNADYVPSERELKEYGLTINDWSNNVATDDGWGGECPVQELDITCDGHFESQWQYELCKKIVKALNT